MGYRTTEPYLYKKYDILINLIKKKFESRFNFMNFSSVDGGMLESLLKLYISEEFEFHIVLESVF